MIQIKPKIQHDANCPSCGRRLVAERVLWQGIHVCVTSTCFTCRSEIVDDLRVGHAIFAACRVDLKAGRVYIEDQNSISWFGNPLLRSLEHPASDANIRLNVEKISDFKKVIILNCIDFLYGHSLLKLLNAESHLKQRPEYGLILLVPAFLRWMIPQGVAEVWTVNIPLAKAQNYYPQLDKMITKECERFDEIYVSSAHSHPKHFEISHFTGVNRYDFAEEFRITFIWREDRLWVKKFWARLGNLAILNSILLKWQNLKVRRLFALLRKNFPSASFTVAGAGKTTSFHEWVDDKRVERFDAGIERELCRVYSESRLVLGVHGSNMLLPSAHAGMTVDLMPAERWSNFAQDIIYQEEDNRLASYKYRYLPLGINLSSLANIISAQLRGYAYFKRQMIDELLGTIAPEG
jgi:hypothetical protein